MFQLAEIDPCQKHACPRPIGGAKIALALAVAVHGILIAALAAVHLAEAPAPVAEDRGELQAVFAAAPGTSPDRSWLETFAAQAPRLAPSGSEPQLLELPYAPSEIAIPEIAASPETLHESLEKFAGEFIPANGQPTDDSTSAPPVRRNSEGAEKPSRKPSSKPRSVAKPKVLSAKVRSTSRPAYPASAKRRGHEGVAQIRLTLDATGKVTGAVVAQSSGHAILDAAALKAAARWKFTPATSGGDPIASVIVIPIRFSLK